MGMSLTDKERFLISMYSYIKGGFDGFLQDENTYIHDNTIKGRQELSHVETLEILSDKEKLIGVDVIFEELDYFGVTLDDFEWHK